MNTIINAIALVVLFAAISTARTTTTPSVSCLPVTTVESFNITEYVAAPWYVQQQAVNTYTPLDQNRCVTAQYQRRHDANANWREHVLNYAETATGTPSGGSLCADYDEEMPSKLRVAPCNLPPLFAGPYWVVSYREGIEDGYALVSGGQPHFVVEGETNCGVDGTEPCCKTGDGINRSGLWILTRQRNPAETLGNEVREIAKQMGFSTSVLFNVTHDADCQVPGIDDNDDAEKSNSARFLRHPNN